MEAMKEQAKKALEDHLGDQGVFTDQNLEFAKLKAWIDGTAAWIGAIAAGCVETLLDLDCEIAVLKAQIDAERALRDVLKVQADVGDLDCEISKLRTNVAGPAR